MARSVQQTSEIDVLAYPPPYACWLALSSDPDATTLRAWQAVHDLVWEELGLPFADSFFVINRNCQLPDQVNLTENPEILTAHPHDTMHTWGDYIHSDQYRFRRDDAQQGLNRLRELGCEPRVWSDHSNFTGNLLHRNRTRMAPTLKDAGGHVFNNDQYTLDYIHAAGVRYVWDGTLIPRVLGQDRPMSRREWYQASATRYRPAVRNAISIAHALSSRFAEFRNPEVFTYSPTANRQYIAHQFLDGTRMYRFPRLGTWGDGDIDGLARVIAPARIEQLIESTGTAIVYTHLGKRKSDRSDDAVHVPGPTEEALRNLARQFAAGNVNLSSTSKLLDYLVLRDHIRVAGNVVAFEPDDIRFPELAPADLSGHSFGLRVRARNLEVTCNGAPVSNYTVTEESGQQKLAFP